MSGFIFSQHVCHNSSATIELCTPFLKGRPFQDLHVKKVLGKKKKKKESLAVLEIHRLLNLDSIVDGL